MKTLENEASLLLAYYFGNLKIINCVALQNITGDLVNRFQTPPSNNTTKYSGHTDICCICHEKKVLFKSILNQYYKKSAQCKSNSERHPPDVNKCWEDLQELWQNNGIVQDWDKSASDIDTEKYRDACLDLLTKHKINLHEVKTQKLQNSWTKLLSHIKKELEGCIDSISKINDGKLDATPLATVCPHFSKARLRNTYLTLLISKGARTRAKFLQECRDVGVQIRAARDPISVVCKYIMCGKCLEKPNHRKLVNVTDILRLCLTEFSVNVAYNKLPDYSGKLQSEQTKIATSHLKRKRPKVEVTICSPTHLNMKDLGAASNPKPSADPVFFVANPSSSVLVKPHENQLKRRLSLPAATAKKICFERRSFDKDGLNVVIVSSDGQSTTPLQSLVTSKTTPRRILGLPQHTSGRPINIKSVRVFNSQLKSQISFPKLVTTTRKHPLTHLGGMVTTNHGNKRSDNVAFFSKNNTACPIFLPALEPVSVAGRKKVSLQTSSENVQKKPFVVQIIDNGTGNATSTVTESKPKKQLIKTLPFSNSAIKFVKAVSLPNQAVPAKTPGTIFVKGLKLPNSLGTRTSTTTIVNMNGLRPLQPVRVVSSNLKSGSVASLAGTSKWEFMKRLQSFKNSVAAKNTETVTIGPQSDAIKKISCSQVKLASRTPSKKRSRTVFPSKPISTVVAEYILSLTPSADKDLWSKLKNRTKRRWEKSSSLIPVPYETHFLCIDTTIEKQGWKAYWYRKCRCSKFREKSAGLKDDSEFSKGHSLDDIKDWIPSAVTEQMRKEFSSAFEREDSYTSPSTSLSISNPSKELATGTNYASTPKKHTHEKTQVDLSRVKLEFEKPQGFTQPLSAKAPETSCNLQQLILKDSSSAKTPSITLKAKYCRGKNGLWKPMDKVTNQSPQKKSLEMTSSSVSADSVKLNLNSAFVQRANAFNSPVKDTNGALNVNGVRRCPRATMLRRKSLVDRALKFERNTNAKRQKIESNAMENFMFSSTCDSSALERGFSVIAAHPVVFKECENLQGLFEVISKGKCSSRLNVCKQQPHSIHEEQSQKKCYDSALLSIMQNMTATPNIVNNNQDNKTCRPATKKRKSQLLSELEVAWDKSSIAGHSNGAKKMKILAPTVAKGKRQPVKQYRRKRVCVMQILPETVYHDLQMLRGMSASDPPSTLISADSAKFIASALKMDGGPKVGKKTEVVNDKAPYHISEVEFKNITDQVLISSNSDMSYNLLQAAELQKLSSREICKTVSFQDTVIAKLSSEPKCPKPHSVIKHNHGDINCWDIPSINAIFHKLSTTVTYRNSPTPKSICKGFMSLDRFHRELKGSLQFSQTLSCLLGSRSVLRLEQEQGYADVQAAPLQNEVQSDHKKVDSCIDSSQLRYKGNRRKRRASFMNGIEGLENGCRKILMHHKMQEHERHAFDFDYEKPMSSLLSTGVDVKSLKHNMWETTSARPIGLQFNWKLNSNVVASSKKVLEPPSSATNVLKVDVKEKNQDSTAKDPPKLSIPQTPCLCPNLMLIKHNSSVDKDLTSRRPQGISKARLMLQKQTHNDKLDCNLKLHVTPNGWSPHLNGYSKEQKREFSAPKLEYSVPRGRYSHVTGTSRDRTNVQMLRETVFAELKSRKKARFDKEQVNDSNNPDRKLSNRCATNGNFISRLLQFDSEQLLLEDT